MERKAWGGDTHTHIQIQGIDLYTVLFVGMSAFLCVCVAYASVTLLSFILFISSSWFFTLHHGVCLSDCITCVTFSYGTACIMLPFTHLWNLFISPHLFMFTQWFGCFCCMYVCVILFPPPWCIRLPWPLPHSLAVKPPGPPPSPLLLPPHRPLSLDLQVLRTTSSCWTPRPTRGRTSRAMFMASVLLPDSLTASRRLTRSCSSLVAPITTVVRARVVWSGGHGGLVLC